MRISQILDPIKELMPVVDLAKIFDRGGLETPEKALEKEIDNSMEEESRANVDNLEEVNSSLRLTNKLLSYNISKFETVLDNLNEGLILLDSSSRVLAINHIMEQLLNLKREDVRGKHVRDCQNHNGIFTFILENYESIDKLVEKTTDIAIGPSSLRVSYKTLIRDDGNSCGSLLIAKDVTSQKFAEEAKVEFLSHVSHELKAPLNTIKAYTEMLVDGEANNMETIREFCNTVNEEADRLAGLINNLLHLSKIEMGSLTLSTSMTKTREFLENIFKLATSQKKKDIKYEIILPDNVPPANIDKEFMGIALINLIGNAIKYTPEHGRVTLRVDEEGDNLMIHVIDTGIGIAGEELPHIFEKFYRSPDEHVRQHAGHGLGLSIARQIVELHGGEVKVISKLGEGTQFSIVLPIEEGYFLE